MADNTSKQWSTIVILLVTATGADLAAAKRTWTDATGKFKVTAEFVAVARRQGRALPRGRQADQSAARAAQRQGRVFIEARRAEGPAIDAEAVAEDIAKAAKKFYSDLHSSDVEAG